MCENGNDYSKAKTHIILMALVIIGSINWGSHALGYNLVDALSREINKIFNSNLPINNIIYIFVAIAGLWLASKRTSWLPFLGKTVFPESLVPLKQPVNTDTSIKIKTIPNVKIAYWSALNKGETTKVNIAYGSYENSGVVMSDANGNATLPIMIGTGYTLPSGSVLPRHVHYRVVSYPNSNGMMGKIKTIFY
jgi:uncharacterized membrane protein YuzA (DUF378 family)